MNSAKHRIAIASKTATGQYGSSTVSQITSVSVLTVGGVVPKVGRR